MIPYLIMLVENDVNLRQSIALILQRDGFLVSGTGCVFEALDLLRMRPYQLVISDINIPETSLVLIPELHTRFPQVSLLVLTDQAPREQLKDNPGNNAHYLVKPLAPEGLLDHVRSLLGHASTHSHPDSDNQPGMAG